jgi:hypothetical protein
LRSVQMLLSPGQALELRGLRLAVTVFVEATTLTV